MRIFVFVLLNKAMHLLIFKIHCRKNELKSVNNLVEENASLPMTVKMVNEKLMIAAKDAGINLEDIGDTANENDLEEDGATGSIDAEQSNDDAVGSMPNAAALSAAADKLTEKMKYALK